MRNAFTFDSQVRVKKYVVKLKGLLLWQFTTLEKSRNLNHEESELCNVTQHLIANLIRVQGNIKDGVVVEQ